MGIPNRKVEEVSEFGEVRQTTWDKGSFRADPTIFKDGIKFDEQTIVSRLRSTAYLNKEITIKFVNHANGTNETFHYEGGIADDIKYLTENKTDLYPNQPIYLEGSNVFNFTVWDC